MWPFVLFITFVIAYFIQYVYKRSRYFADRNITTPPGQYLFGNIKDMFLASGPLQLQKWSQEYGETYGIYEGPQPILVTSDLELLHDVFVKKFAYFHSRKQFPLEPPPDGDNVHVFIANGMRWKRMRAITNPAFSVAKLKRVMPTIHELMGALVHRVKENAATKEDFDMYPLYQEFSLDVIAHIAFGETRSLQLLADDEPNPYIQYVRETFQFPKSKLTVALLMLSIAFPELNWLASALQERFGYDPVLNLLGGLTKLVDERRKGKQTDSSTTDFIQLFLDAEATDFDEIGSSALGTDAERLSVKSGEIRKRLTASEISMNLVLFLLAGYDTTSNTLAYATYLLATHPDVQAKVHAEIQNVIGHHNESTEIGYDQLQKLSYLEMVVKETLRMYPLASIANTRKCAETCEVAGGRVLEKGLAIWPDVFSIHYNKDTWGEDADKFRPERFAEKINRHPMAWLPFGAGPRMCQGMKLAMMQVKMVLCEMLTQFSFHQTDNTQVPLKIGGVATLSPEHVTIRVQRR